MHVPTVFRENRRDVLVEAMTARSFGALVSTGDRGIALSHLPFICREVDGQVELLAHLHRQNQQVDHLCSGREVVVSFLIDDAYISPGWYPSKQETGRAVPTWNYVAVEARGIPQIVEDKSDLLTFVEAVTARHEAGRETPWSSADAPAEYIDGLLTGIVGVRIKVHELTGAWKLGQNKSASDRKGAAQGLSDDQRHSMANWMAGASRTCL
ncbi:FMN-binding negative transcriptional regulator [Novosphingobium umbonatum]|uniref:FMN-binding negative transcriptional regulator n=1 Tax=Novosphingobium umbonatum TaxID=1908524 RepID=A0A3S2Y517_9SPHN|nr:FMN-binding negative transcriptional regulator [Novosphingobium umbonatum]RVU02213.1 FMN-binding negative transcriptional regulator [Novosphingobium umbonatum]